MVQGLFEGGGAMSALMRATRWDGTPVGSPDSWPVSLRTAVSLLLGSKFPMLLCWGPDFTQFYNDAFRPILGTTKHPAIGKSARETYSEAWHIVGPLFDRVLAGESVGFEDMLVPLDRHGFLEECYFTYSYSPFRCESGEVAGVFVTCAETTGRVVGERRLRLLRELSIECATETVGEVRERAIAVVARYPDDLASVRIELEGDPDAGAPPAALDVPIQASPDSVAGRLLAEPSAMLPVDDQYRGFVSLLAREIGTSLWHARALESEKRRAEALAELDQAKTAFFSNVSHEFRSPLTLMLGPVEEALAAPGGSIAGDQLAAIHRNMLRLLKLVNNLLDVSRLEAGGATARLEAVDLAQLTADLASTFRSAIELAGLDFHVDCPPLPGPVDVDREAWEKIVLNLLSNALKFTFDGAIGVSLREVDGRVELRVTDTGVGIAADEVQHVFDRFRRVEGSRARTHEGSGIGLALVSELVKLHGGSTTVESEPGRGTTFTIAVPATRDARRSAVPSRSGDPIASAQPYLAEVSRWLAVERVVDAAPRSNVTILVVDDNVDMREYLTHLLSDRWTVVTAPDGDTGLTIARRSRPALVISDVMMPGLDGFGVLRGLRTDEATRDIPVILLSARAGEESSIEGLKAGADDYLVKPFSARDLRARVEAQLLRGESRAMRAAQTRQLAELFRLAPVAVALLQGPEHTFLYANDEYRAVVGRGDLVGSTVADALPEAMAQGVGELLDRVYASGEPYRANAFRLRLNRTPGEKPRDVYLRLVCEPMFDASGVIHGIAVIAVDVSEVVRGQQEAEAANRAKDQFLAMLGHELRTPLAPILTAVELLNVHGPRDPRLQRFRDTIGRQTQHLNKLVEDLLDVGRVVTGKLRLDRTRVDVIAVVRQAVEMTMPAIDRRGHTLELFTPDTPVFADLDVQRMRQVVSNLLTNAAKFTPDGGRIEVRVGAEDGLASIRVRDYGVGIPPDMIDRVFERFVQAPTEAKVTEGLGVGLSIVKTIVELHGGTVVARSDGPGLGSEFTVVVPDRGGRAGVDVEPSTHARVSP